MRHVLLPVFVRTVKKLLQWTVWPRILLFVGATGPLSCNGVKAQAIWTNLYNGEANGREIARAIAVGLNGNVYVAGSSDGSGASGDYAIVAYTSAGLPIWTNRYAGPPSTSGSLGVVAVVATSNVYVTGSVGNSSAADFVTIAYTGAGMPLWTNRFDGPENNEDIATALAVDANETVFVTGYSDGSNRYDYVTIAYSSLGTPLWTNWYDGPLHGSLHGYDAAFGVAVDTNQTVFVTGFSAGGLATIAYSNTGEPLWTNRYEGVGGYQPYMALDKNGNIFISGSGTTVGYSNTGVLLWSNHSDGPAGGIAVSDSGNVFVAGGAPGNGTAYDYLTIAYSNDGLPLWTNRYNGPANGNDAANGIAVGSDGNIIVTGTFGLSATTSPRAGYATIAYSTSGTPLWTNWYMGAGGEALAVAVSADGDVFVTGYAYFGSNADFATIKYASMIRPRITVSRVGGEIVLSWPSTFTDFSLQESIGLQPAAWNDVSEAAVDDGITTRVTLQSGSGNRFFRLRN